MRALLWITLLFVLARGGAADGRSALLPRRQLLLVPPAVDRALGSVAASVVTFPYIYPDASRANHKRRRLPSAAIHNQQLLTKIGKELAEIAERSFGIKLQWEWHLILDPLAEQAFCVPGGKVFVTSAFINKLVRNEAMGTYRSATDVLAFVLAHEIAHAVARHSAERLSLAGLFVVAAGIGKLLLPAGLRIMGLCNFNFNLDLSPPPAGAADEPLLEVEDTPVAGGASDGSSVGREQRALSKPGEEATTAAASRPQQRQQERSGGLMMQYCRRLRLLIGPLAMQMANGAGSRMQEAEADRLAVAIIRQSRYDPAAGVEFFSGLCDGRRNCGKIGGEIRNGGFRNGRFKNGAIDRHSGDETPETAGIKRPLLRQLARATAPLLVVFRCAGRACRRLDELLSTHPSHARRMEIIKGELDATGGADRSGKGRLGGLFTGGRRQSAPSMKLEYIPADQRFLNLVLAASVLQLVYKVTTYEMSLAAKRSSQRAARAATLA